MDAPIAPHLDVYLWPEEGRLRWWTADATDTFESHPPERLRPGCPEAEQRGLEELLPGPLVARILAAPRTHLHLDPALPRDWQQQPWEWLRHQGRPLAGRLLALRHAQRAAPSAVADGKVAVIDLWPGTEAVQPFESVAPRVDDIQRGAGVADYWLQTTDLTALAALVVIAHGAPRPPWPLLDERGRGWQLPTARGLPPLVVLLACDEGDGHALSEGVRLLGAGARSVVVSLGQLNACQAADFLQRLLKDRQAGLSPADTLLALQGEGQQAQGAARLCLLGDGGLHRETGDRAEALPELLTRITRTCWRDGWKQNQALEQLFEARGLTSQTGNDKAAHQLLRELQESEDQLPRLVQAWTLGLMAYLAEVHDHDLLGHCNRRRRQVAELLPDTPEQRHFWSKLHYREGRYREALKELSAGLALDENHPRLLGALVNCLLDLNLPASAAAVMARLEDLVDEREDAEDRRFDLLDRKARLCMRDGRLRAALAHYRKKHHAALNRGRDGRRELAGLLYGSGWLENGAEDEARWQAEALAAFPESGRVAQTLGRGNDNLAYLLRALALWSWRRSDTQAAEVVDCQVPLLLERSARQDPGPFGMALVFLRLHQRQRDRVSPHLEAAWEEVASLMEDEHYWLELAALHYLAGETGPAARCLDRFRSRRRQALGVTLPPWLHQDVQDECQAREAIERQVLLDSAAAVRLLTDHGLQPL